MITKIEGKCQYENCKEPATMIASGRNYHWAPGHGDPACYCAKHAEIVADEDNPEYQTECPNCGCLFGVN